MLMIVAMGMDWFLLLSAVSGLTIGNALTEMHKSPRKRRVHEEHVELLNKKRARATNTMISSQEHRGRDLELQSHLKVGPASERVSAIYSLLPNGG